jgi:glycosyltransferase involved in cell wall biosynthesis
VALPEVEDGENMLVVEPEAPKALARAVSQLAADPQLRARLEAGATSLAARFQWDQIAERTAAFFTTVRRGAP